MKIIARNSSHCIKDVYFFAKALSKKVKIGEREEKQFQSHTN